LNLKLYIARRSPPSHPSFGLAFVPSLRAWARGAFWWGIGRGSPQRHVGVGQPGLDPTARHRSVASMASRPGLRLSAQLRRLVWWPSRTAWFSWRYLVMGRVPLLKPRARRCQRVFVGKRLILPPLCPRTRPRTQPQQHEAETTVKDQKTFHPHHGLKGQKGGD
jgi:hypothetical protein